MMSHKKLYNIFLKLNKIIQYNTIDKTSKDHEYNMIMKKNQWTKILFLVLLKKTLKGNYWTNKRNTIKYSWKVILDLF